VLADPAKRRELDLSLAMWAGGGAASRGPAGGFGNYSSYYNQQEDEEEDFASYFSSMFGRRYGGSSGYSGSARRGAPTGTRQQYSSYGRNY
jgi:DnaJ-class molecular chaperone